MDGSPEEESSSPSSQSSPSSSGSTIYTSSFQWPYDSMGLPGIEIVGGVNGMDKRSDAAAGEMALTSEFWMNNYHQDLGIAAVKIEDATIDGDSREDASILFDSDILSTLPFQASDQPSSSFCTPPLLGTSLLLSDKPSTSISPSLTNLQLLPVEQETTSDLSDLDQDDQDDNSDEKSAVPPGGDLSHTSKSCPAPPGGTNLVAKDMIVAASVIPGAISPLATTLAQRSAISASPQLLVLGVPAAGAKSRVETQIKISLVLVRPKRKGQSEEEVASDGGLKEGVGMRVDRIGTWSHLKLPKFLTLRQKNKKQTKKDPSPANTLFLEVALLAGSAPFQEIFICTGCQQREQKRSQRKKDARVKPVVELGPLVLDEEEEKRKVVVFNCAEFIEFGTGEVFLPTRITCYCRHHKEKLGFSMSFSLKDCDGNLIASGSTPPIMITDDHKTNFAARPPISLSDQLNVTTAASSHPSTKSKPGRSAKKVVNQTRPEDSRPGRGTIDRPRRSSVRSRATRGVMESEDDEDEATMLAASSSSRHSKRTSSGSTKPYDSDARNRKRQSGAHRSPSFAMTPLLTMSKPGSPLSRPVGESSTSLPPVPPLSVLHRSASSSASSPPSPNSQRRRNSLDAALGMTDLIMRDAPMYSSSETTAPSPSSSYDWNTPTDAINIPHDNDFSIFYGDSSTLRRIPPDHLHSTVSPSYLIHPQTYPMRSYDPASPTSIPAAGAWAYANRPALLLPPPRISRLIPGEGPVHGGIEVTVLGENFVRDLTCVFGDSPAMTTHFWSSNTLICILPPSSTPGPVVVGIKGTPLSVEDGLQLFTYRDDSDRSLLELALQVVGLKMTGRLEDAKNVAMRIVGSSQSSTSPATSRQVSPTDAASFASAMTAATSSVYDPLDHSRRMAMVGSERNFEAIVIKFLSLLDLDASLIPGSTSFAPPPTPAISHQNSQRHTLLHLATVLGFSRLVQFLLSRNVDIDAADRNGFTALHFSALYGRLAITRYLMEAGAASYKRNRAGRTAAEIAHNAGDIDVEEVLMRSRSMSTIHGHGGSGAGRRETSSIRGSSSRMSSGRSTPASSYALSEASDWDASLSDENNEDDDDDDNFSFHSSDEDLNETLDLERGLSRSNSVVSLHYLLHMEDDEAEERSALRRVYSDSIQEDVALRSIDGHDDVDDGGGTKTDVSFVSKEGVWQRLPSLSLPKGAPWASMKLPTGMGIEYFARGMPRLVAFPSVMHLSNLPSHLWRSNEKDADGATTTDSVEVESKSDLNSITGGGKSSMDWRNYIWQPTSTSSTITSPSISAPPPMYSPTDPQSSSLNLPSTSAGSPITLPAPTLAPAGPSKALVQAKLQRRVGYIPDTISDRVVQSYLHAEKKRKSLRNDRMLFVFWIPALLLVLAWALYSSGVYLRPLLLSMVDRVLPFALH